MWARRLGVPPLWPSRVKVFFLGLLTSVFIFSVFQYLHNANVEYLDLNDPVDHAIMCKLPREECRKSERPLECTVRFEEQSSWRSLNLSNPCPMLPRSLQGSTCHNLSLPLAAITGDLSTLHTVNNIVNPFKLWSILFLILTSLLSISIVIHDLALLEERLRPTILSIPNMKYATPRLWTCLRCMQCARRMRRLRAGHKCLWTVLVPLWTLFQIMSFMALMYPLALLVWFVAPVRMSRIMVFLSGILCMLWSVVFIMITTLIDRQVYAVLWNVSVDVSNLDSCMCLCEFPLSKFVIVRIVILGIGVCWHSFNLTFRALKGLRRGQWANMFSVLYAVPIEAFPVIWERPLDAGGGPVTWRSEGQPVQAEPAFDPFCLMDEQPESALTRVLIVPVATSEQQQLIWEPYTGTLDTGIGCCGFPRPHDVSDGADEEDLPRVEGRTLEDVCSVVEAGRQAKRFNGTAGRSHKKRMSDIEIESLSSTPGITPSASPMGGYPKPELFRAVTLELQAVKRADARPPPASSLGSIAEPTPQVLGSTESSAAIPRLPDSQTRTESQFGRRESQDSQSSLTRTDSQFSRRESVDSQAPFL